MLEQSTRRRPIPWDAALKEFTGRVHHTGLRWSLHGSGVLAVRSRAFAEWSLWLRWLLIPPGAGSLSRSGSCSANPHYQRTPNYRRTPANRNRSLIVTIGSPLGSRTP
jgi:hypothetical protein